MIIYFSATGNCKYIATKIAKATNNEYVSMIKCVNSGKYTFNLEKDNMFGIVVPTYFYGLPSYVKSFLEKIQIIADDTVYVFIIVTYGTSSGYATNNMEKYLKKQNISVSAKFDIKMVDTWTPVFDLTDKDKIKRIEDETEVKLKSVIKKIQNKEEGNFVKSCLPSFISPFAHTGYEIARKTSHLHITDDCVGCGMCAKRCPIQAIKMEHDRPVHITKKCVMCLRCLHKCPVFATQYDNRTQKHGQYTNPNIVTLD